MVLSQTFGSLTIYDGRILFIAVIQKWMYPQHSIKDEGKGNNMPWMSKNAKAQILPQYRKLAHEVV